MPKNQLPTAKRAGLYVDAFNLYHAVNKLGEPWLKWLNLWRLGDQLAAPNAATLTRCVFCTAVPEHTGQGPRDRHNLFNAALTGAGVEVIKGHHVFNEDIQRHSEKQSDINVALSLVLDAEDDKIDVAMLLSADSDQAATARVFKQRHPTKELLLIAPPGQAVPKKAIPYADKHFVLSKMQLDAAVFPQTVPGLTRPITRPSDYDPPAWWMHPDDRPKRSK